MIPRRRPRRWCLGAAALATLLLQGGCESTRDPGPPRPMLYGGEPEVGASLIRAMGCGSCHTIPGIRGARGLVGPPLTGFAHRTYIAGSLMNEPPNLIAWIMNPQEIEPGTAMPDLGVTEVQARNIAAYLYTLR